MLTAFPCTTTGQEAIEVPPVEVEGEPVSRDPDEKSTHVEILEDPAVLEAPAGPAREAVMAASIRVHQSGGVGQPVGIGIRGIDPQGTLSTLDGIPLNSPFMGGADLSGLGLLPLVSLEISRGGLSARRGSDAVGGVLDARTPSPLDLPGAQGSLTLGSFGTARLKAAYGGCSGQWGGMAAIGLLTSSGNFPFKDSNGRARSRSHNAAMAMDGMVKFDVEPAEGHVLTMMAEGFADDRDVPGLEQFPSSTATQRDQRILASIAYDGPPMFAASGSTHGQVYFRWLGFDYEDESPPMGPSVSTRLDAWEVGGIGSGSEQLSAMFALPWGVGVTYTGGKVDRVSRLNASPWRMTVHALMGLHVGGDKDPFGVDVTVRGEYDRGFGWRVVPRSGAWYRPWRLLKLFANVGHAFRLPTFEELYFEAGYIQGNPDLDPEEALTWDAGFAVGVEDLAILRVTYFENRVKNLIQFLPRSAFLVKADNSGSALLRGVEASGKAFIGPVSLGVSYTFLDAGYDSGGAMPHRPRHSGAGEVVYRAGPVKISARVHGQSFFYLDRYESLTEEFRVILDARLELTPHPYVTLSFDVNNILDKRDAMDALQYPLPGRAFYGTLRFYL